MASQPSRRDVLRTGAALSGLATLGSMAGCSSLLDSEDDSSSETLTTVPERADAAARIDVETVLDDRGTEGVMNAMLSIQAERDWYEGPTDFADLLSEFEDEQDLDPEGVTSLTGFFAWSDGDTYRTISEEFYGYVVRADWSEDDLVDSLEQNGPNYDEDDHADQPVYEPDSEYALWLGVLGDGEYVLGTEDGVKDVIDVVVEDGDTLDSDLQSAYGTTRSGPARFVSTVPADQFPDTAGNGQVNLGILDDVEMVGGAAYRNGDNRGVEMTFTAEDEDAADDAAAMLDGVVTLASDTTTYDSVADELDAVEVTQNGSTVTTSYEGSISDLVDVVEETMDYGSGGGGGGGTVQTPQVAFSFEYEETKGDRGTLTITHDGGDTVKQSELYVRGQGFAVVPNVDQRESGRWAGSASGTMGGDSAVVAGDSVTLGVGSEYEMRVVWQSESGDSSATLAVARGPDA